MYQEDMALDPAQTAYQHAHSSENRAPGMIAAQTTCLVIAILGVSLRFTARRLARAAITVDDYLIILALVWEELHVDEMIAYLVVLIAFVYRCCDRWIHLLVSS